jgi:hypothetical protein
VQRQRAAVTCDDAGLAGSALVVERTLAFPFLGGSSAWSAPRDLSRLSAALAIHLPVRPGRQRRLVVTLHGATGPIVLS